MSLKHKLKYLSSARRVSDTMIPWLPLASMFADADRGVSFHFIPNLETGKDSWEWLSFSKWWEEEIFRIPSGQKLSRKNLVFAMRSQDGGAHVDEEIRDADYAILRSYNDPRMTRSKYRPGEKPRLQFRPTISISPHVVEDDYEPVPHAHLATMRQIAFEIKLSIGRLIGGEVAT
jgi:hypothetical protein